MGRILVVDDDPPTADAMAELLRQDGHEVERFTSGKEAVSALQSGRPFDVVVTDLQMPVVDGAAVTRAARAGCPNACIVVTDQSAQGPRDLESEGACLVLDKPIEYDAVHLAIAACRAHGGYAGARCALRHPGVAEGLARVHRRR